MTALLDERGAERALAMRLKLAALCVGYLLLNIPVVIFMVTTSVSMAVMVVGIGIVLLSLFLPVFRALADQHRRMAELTLGGTIQSPYRSTVGMRVSTRLGTWLSDPATWRDLLWGLVSCTVGLFLTALALGSLLAVGWYLVFPLVFELAPDGVFDVNYGLFTIDTFRESFYEWIWAVVCALIWWYGAPYVVRWRAQLDRALLSPSKAQLERRVAAVAESRAETIDHSAAELRRIERDLHDGAQARLVALGMNLGMAEEMLRRDPESAAELLEEARNATTSALGDLRSVVRGIHPPVLADRGLDGAVRALALDMAMPVDVTISLDGRAPAPVESAAYFAVAEMLANVGKHANAATARIDIRHAQGVLRMTVTDDGRGGADLAGGTGLAGVRRRLAAFDGTMEVVSPTGGPTTVTMELPCVLSSPRTSPS